MRSCSFRCSSPQGPQLLSPTGGLYQPHPTPAPQGGGEFCPQGQAPPTSVWGVENNGKQPERIALSQKTALLLLPTTPGDHWREMGSWKGKTALPAWQPPSWLPVSKVTGLHGKKPTVLWPPLLPQHSLSVHTALQGPSPPPSLPPEGITPHLPVPQMQTTVKNRASLLVPVSSGTRCSHKRAGWQGLLGKRAGPESGVLGTDIEKNE